MDASVLVIDDDERLRAFLARQLVREGFSTVAAEGGERAIALLKESAFDAVVCDLHMPEVDGFHVLRFSTTLSPPPPFIMLTAYGSVSAAVEAMKHGAADFLEKPVESDELSAAIRAVLSRKQENPKAPAVSLVGSKLWLDDFVVMLRRVAQSDATVLIGGETGTGKTAVARELWKASARADGPFVDINCAAIPDDLMESELFGHVKGAFTGADTDYLGKVGAAENGTLFLDEVGELKPELQAKLLHLLQERTYTPVGVTQPRQANVRFLAATNRNLAEDVESGLFRRDLFYRLEVVSLTIPALRDRSEDLTILLEHFRQRLRDREGSAPIFSDEAIRTLHRYDWPGNVRELQNLVERFGVMHAPNSVIEEKDLPPRMREATRAEGEATTVPKFSEGAGLSELESEGFTLQTAVRAYEKRLINGALDRTEGNRSQAARVLGMKRTTLIEKLKKYDQETDA